MEEQGVIEIRVKGRVGDKSLTPLDVDISEIKDIISDIESFIFPSVAEKRERPHIAYSIEDGSALHRFFLPITSVILFNGLTEEISHRQSIDFLDYKRGEIIEKFQRKAKDKMLEISFSNSISKKDNLVINKETNYYQAQAEWINTDINLYGEIFQEGGINPNLHILTKEFGKLTVSATKEQLTEGENKLYKVYGLRVSAKQNLKNKSLSDIKLMDFIEHNPVFDKNELSTLIKKATPNWAKVNDIDKWLKQIRGAALE